MGSGDCRRVRPDVPAPVKDGLSFTTTSVSITAPGATAGNGARNTRPSLNSAPIVLRADSVIVAGSSGYALPSAVTTRALIDGFSSRHGDQYAANEFDEARAPARV